MLDQLANAINGYDGEIITQNGVKPLSPAELQRIQEQVQKALEISFTEGPAYITMIPITTDTLDEK